jgi:hypothetical protein
MAIRTAFEAKQSGTTNLSSFAETQALGSTLSAASPDQQKPNLYVITERL